MKITVEKPSKHTFDELRAGDVFWPDDGGWYDKEELFIVVEPDYGLGKNEKFDGYAVHLKNGDIYGFNKDEIVIQFDLTVTARAMD